MEWSVLMLLKEGSGSADDELEDNDDDFFFGFDLMDRLCGRGEKMIDGDDMEGPLARLSLRGRPRSSCKNWAS